MADQTGPTGTEAGERPVVVVVGAGFAGLWAVQKLVGEPVDVVLLDRQNYHTFLPLLYQVAAAELGPTEIAYPVRSILRKATNVTFRMAELVRVDPEARVVKTSAGRIHYDHLLLAMGATTHYFGVEGAAEHAFPLRAMDEAVPLRHHVLSRFEAAAHEADPERRKKLLTFSVVGGGPTGVEFSGALAELVHGPLAKDYPMIDMDEVRIILLEAMDRVLGGMRESLSEYARDRLVRRRVDVRLETPVERVGPDFVELAGGEVIHTSAVVWTGGVRGVPGPESWGLPMGPGARVEATKELQVRGRGRIWVAGDLAYLEDPEGEPYPGVAPVAIQQGSLVARNILALQRGDSVASFRYKDPGMMAVIGRNAAVAQVGGRTFTGFVAWVMWLVVHVAKLIGFRNRALVLVNWAWNYISFERAVRLILPYERGHRASDVVPDDPAKPVSAEGDAGPASEELDTAD